MELNKYIDHTLLKPSATKDDLIKLCEEGKKYKFASICVNPCNVKFVNEYLGGEVAIASVIGFPFGTHTTKVKLIETEVAIDDGANEIDMVINVGKLLENDYGYVQNEVAEIVDLCHSKNVLLKVIIETAYLSDELIAKMCEIVSNTGADYIKTSTGYASRGASVEDIKIFKANLAEGIKIKASGGIRTPEDAKMYIELGAERIGTSGGVNMMNNESNEHNY